MAKIKPHFLKSIREIDGDIVELQNSITPIQNDIGRLLATRATIVELYGADTEIPSAPGAGPVEALRQQRPTQEKPKRKYKTRAGPSTAAKAMADRDAGAPLGGGKATGAGDSGDAAAGRLSPDTRKLMAAVRVAAEPFTVKSLAVVTELEGKFIANRLFTWLQAAFIKKVARGEYSRTGSFPTAD